VTEEQDAVRDLAALPVPLAGVDLGRQVITVARKGSRELQELPACARSPSPGS
jgi:hypothetical protein